MPRRQSRSTLAQALAVFSFNIIGLFADGLVNLYTSSFNVTLWILALFSLIWGIIGDISSVLYGNLSIIFHRRQVESKINKNNSIFYLILAAIFVLIFINILAMRPLYEQVSPDQLYISAIVPTMAQTLTIIFSMLLATLVVIGNFKKRLNLMETSGRGGRP